jgi:PhoPQ-activated pathogenicity-related protein
LQTFYFEKNDPTSTPKTEDQIVAWTFAIFLQNQSQKKYQNVPLLFPMTKVNRKGFGNYNSFEIMYLNMKYQNGNQSLFLFKKAVKRGLDAVQMFSKDIRIQPPKKFVLSGISKRGWAAWLASAVDTNRVIAFIPIVFDLVYINQV